MTVFAKDDQGFYTLQGLIWPDAALNQEPLLYMREAEETAKSSAGGIVNATTPMPATPLHLEPAAEAWFDTYFNLFSLGKWCRHCGIKDLHLALNGAGRIVLTVGVDTPGADGRVQRRVLRRLTLDLSARIDLSDFVATHVGSGTIWFAVTAKADSTLETVAWQTRQAPLRTPSLVLAITTYRREAAVRRSVARFERFMERTDIAPHLHLVVVDNGQSANITRSAHVTPILNENLGGSGGFARGLIEAKAREASHCLFMDDDAAVHMDSIDRTWRFLAWAKDPATAVAGAMSIAAEKWALWENGALFDSHCRPLHLGTDLRDPNQAAMLDFASTDDRPHNFYGGWWFFAFPVAIARHMPFPFFVRGDDISFSLVHDFNTVTLPGVLSFQDQDFANKESLNTLYLDLRSHLAHHLALPSMDIGLWRSLRIVWWFFARSAVQLHYDTLDALNLSFGDTLEGPDFFEKHADMSERRADLNQLGRDEVWKPIPPGAAQPKTRQWFNPDRVLVRWFLQFTLNAHMLPFFAAYGNRVVLKPGQRGQLHLCWGAAQITYWDDETGQFFTVTHSKRRLLRATIVLLRQSWRFCWNYRRLKADWHSGYSRLTTSDWWHKRLRLT